MMDIPFIIGQILGGIAVVLGFINYQVKSREQVLIVHTATAICFTLHYFLIGALAGAAMNFVGIIRNLVFYFVGKKGKVPKGWAILFAIILPAMGIIGWEAWYSILAVLGLAINSYSMSFSNPNNIRKSILVSSPLVLAYDAFAFSIGGMIYESIVIVSSIIGLIRFKNKKP